ncbi:UNVERIFIED_CONTAM: hypothetical protein PYX00_002608 [Menopon gallinae]|uniref:Thioredoxin domain-containing protein n=1 Tax=Menopon gallinae TaxID=328185 RepID=A0AAW2HX37_9NEOP
MHKSRMLYSVFLSFMCYLAYTLIPTTAESEEKVVHYTAKTFPVEITKNNHFVMFYAPWCGHCKRLLPVWEQLAEMLNDDPEYQIVIAKVDCISDNNLCAKNDVTGYPTLKFFKIGNSEGIKFRGTRDLSSLTSFINEQLGTAAPEQADTPPVNVNGLTELTESSFNKYIQKGNYFIKFFAPWCGHCQKLAPTWEDLAKSLENDESVGIGKVDCTVHKSVCNNLEIKVYPTLLWIQDGKVVEKYQGQRTESELKSFVNKMLGNQEAPTEEEQQEGELNPGVILSLNADNFQQGIAQGVSFVKFFAPWCAYCKRLAPTWNELSKKILGISNVRLVKVDCTLENSKELCNEQEVEGFPTLFLYKNGKKISEYIGSRNLEDLYDFISKYFPHDEL